MNTGDLYTGSNSGSFGTNKAVKKQREELKLSAQELKATMAEHLAQVTKDIDAELERVSSIDSFITRGYAQEEEVRFELEARKRYVEFLKILRFKYTSSVKGIKK